MTSNRQSKQLRGEAAKRVVESCLKALSTKRVSSRHIRDVMRCEDDSLTDGFEPHLKNQDPLIRGMVSKVVARRSPDLVVEAILEERDISVIRMMLQGLEEVKCKEVDKLTPLLREDDSTFVERVFEMFVNVGRADLLFALAIGGDDVTTQRVKRYLNEQGWLD